MVGSSPQYNLPFFFLRVVPRALPSAHATTEGMSWIHSNGMNVMQDPKGKIVLHFSAISHSSTCPLHDINFSAFSWLSSSLFFFHPAEETFILSKKLECEKASIEAFPPFPSACICSCYNWSPSQAWKERRNILQRSLHHPLGRHIYWITKWTNGLPWFCWKCSLKTLKE